jgi:hypothetical protein
MQLLSQVTTVNVPVTPQALHPRFAEFIDRPEIKHMAGAFLVLAVVAQIVAICSYWISSKAVAPRDKSTFGMAMLTWAIYLVASIVWPIALAFLVPLTALLFQHDPIRGWLVVGGTALASFLIFFLIPMRIYVIGFFRAVLFVILAIVISAPVNFAVWLVVGRLMVAPQDIQSLQAVFRPGPESTKFMERLAGREAPDEIDRQLDDALVPIGPKPPLATREAQVGQLQKLLLARKATFPPGRPQPAWEAQRDRYMQFRQGVMNERAAPRQANAQAQ